MRPGGCSGASAPREYTGAIAPAFGENVITHGCSCVSGASAPGDSGGLFTVLLGIAAGVVLAMWGKKSGGAQ